MSSRCYQVHGLQLLSEFDLPELGEGDDSAVDVIEVRWETLRSKCLETAGDLTVTGTEAAIYQPKVGRYAIKCGRSITIQAEPGANPQWLRFYLYARAIPALLYQRRVIPLHASAVEIGGWAAALIGQSGAGKSSLSAALNAQSGRSLADDILTLRLDRAGVIAQKGLISLHLTDEAAATLNFALPPPEERFGARGKHYYASPAPDCVRYPLKSIYFLEWTTSAAFAQRITEVSPFEALARLRESAYYHMFVQAYGLEEEFLNFYSQVLKQVRCFAFIRPIQLRCLPSQASHLIDHFNNMIAKC